MQEATPSNPIPNPWHPQRPRGWKRRIAKACDSCRRKRIKCSGARPVCAQCSSSASSCHYSDAVDSQTRPRPERASRVQRLEQRIHELESELRQYRSLSPTQQSTLDANDRATTQPSSEEDNLRAVVPDDAEGRGTIVIEDTGELRYFGPSSSISILSPNGLQWLESRTADASLRQRLELPLKGGGSWARWTHPLLQPLCPTTTSTVLPPWEDALPLVNDFFENFNAVLPIFHPPTFMGLLGRQYARSANTIDDPAWSAALNAVLAMAQRRRAEQTPGAQQLVDKAWLYAKNALELMLAVLMRSVSLLSVQALLALAWFFRGTPNPQPFFFLTAAAVRLSHSAGLHRKAEHPALSPIDREQRLRVFWIALILDSGASLRTGRPCTHSIDDIGVSLPSTVPKDNLGIVVNRQGTAILNFLSAKAEFAVLEGRIYDRIFAASAANKSMEALHVDVADLGRQLDDWSRNVPGGMNYNTIAEDWGNQQPHIISLVLAYHTCTITVHSATWQRHFSSLRRKKSTGQGLDTSYSAFPHTDKCLNSAYECIRLLPLVPRESTSFVWEIIHRPVQAVMLLFICILQQPAHSDVDTHLSVMNEAVAFMSSCMADQEACFMHPVLDVGHELIRIANAAIQRARTKSGRGQAQPCLSDQPANAGSNIRQFAATHQTISAASLASPASLTVQAEDDDYPGAASGNHATDETRTTQDTTYATVDQPMTYSTCQEGWTLDQAPNMMDEFCDMSLPFTWNWQYLSNGLLEDFNF